MQALSEVISYTVAFDGVKNRYDAKNNPSIPAGQSGCPVLVTHEFTGNSSKNVSISLQLPRSAKRGQPVKRQGFELPWIQINEVK